MIQSVYAGAAVAAAVGGAGALALLLIVRRLCPPSRVPRSNEAVSTFSQVIGTVYAVMMAFMLYTVWTQFQTAETNADREAQGVVNLHYLAGQLPEPDRTQLRQRAAAYVQLVATHEWDRMPEGSMSPVASALINELWQASTAVEAETVSDRVLFDHILTELSTVSETRRLRLLSLHRRLAPILWVVLIAGGLLTVGTLCFFSIDPVVLHAGKVCSTSALIALMLFAIYQLDSPFGGSIRVSSDAFKLAARSFDQYDDAPRAASSRTHAAALGLRRPSRKEAGE